MSRPDLDALKVYADGIKAAEAEVEVLVERELLADLADLVERAWQHSPPAKADGALVTSKFAREAAARIIAIFEKSVERRRVLMAALPGRRSR